MLVIRIPEHRFLLPVIVCLLSAGPALGWSADGHRIVGRIAETRLSEQARAEVARLLALADPPYRTLPNACVWADDARKVRHDTRPWHYANVAPDGNSFDESRDCAGADCCVVWAIEENLATLKDRTRPDAERLEALLFVAHCVGDVHQPLHVGYAHDKGGNDRVVEFFRNRTNLHRVWDGQIIRQTRLRWPDFAADVARDISAAQAEAWGQTLSPAAWADESWMLTRVCVYADIPNSGEIGEAYQNANLPVVRERLAAAGVRLAALLNEALGKSDQ
jgi:hypothetical protein